MRKQMLYILWVLLGLSMQHVSYADLTSTEKLLAEMATVQGNEFLLKESVESGKERSILCGNCHGKDGNSVRDYIPNLASQNAAYLFNQFELFAKGERKDYVMSKLAKVLTRQDEVNIAIYYSQMPVIPRPEAGDVAASIKGKQIYQSLCFTCHQKDGHGDGNYPRIAGQPYKYLVKTLESFSGGDKDRLNSPMAVIVANMNNEQLKEVAAYVARMP